MLRSNELEPGPHQNVLCRGWSSNLQHYNKESSGDMLSMHVCLPHHLTIFSGPVLIALDLSISVSVSLSPSSFFFSSLPGSPSTVFFLSQTFPPLLFLLLTLLFLCLHSSSFSLQSSPSPILSSLSSQPPSSPISMMRAFRTCHLLSLRCRHCPVSVLLGTKL